MSRHKVVGLAHGGFGADIRADIQAEVERLHTELLYQMMAREGSQAVKGNTCLLWALCLHAVLLYRKLPSALRLGTVSYRMVREENDDGVSPTHFSYVLNEKNAMQFILGIAPFLEHHAWVQSVVPGTGERLIIDPSAGYSFIQAVGMLGERIATMWQPTDRFNDWVWLREGANERVADYVLYAITVPVAAELALKMTMLKGLLPLTQSPSLSIVKHATEQTLLYYTQQAKKLIATR